MLHLASPTTPPWRKQWGLCDPHRILMASQCPPEVTTEITSTPPAPGAQVCRGQLWVSVLGPLSGHPGEDAKRHSAAVPGKYCHGWKPAGQHIEAPSKRATGQHTCPESCQKPSMSKVILRAVADKGTCKCVSLATLKKALAAKGYDMARNACHFKHVLKGLVDKGMLKQVTGKGASGSFRLGKKQASKPKLKVKRQRQRRRRSEQRISGQSRSGQHHFRSLLGSKQGHKRLVKGARRVAKCHHN
ncbi:LOW QUALITY PROTEIN: putative histone H1.9 [Callithrix jacchus]|uniref:LOW QUALITY PROTEIN: putative spermatid-specific linker histone H1-like protein n=1 Tax=Callithrix jacchus TaxID=9483 RepID=UPI00084088AF|nr:LOW QUALITY PROTEIN: putative spermatid-specific linker histone H1-like protein [Callithrix jacchus]